MRLTPKQLKGWGVGLKGDYQLRIPINKRADYSLGMELMAQRKAADAIGPSDPWILENLFGIMQPREMFKETLRWDFLKSDQMKRRLLKTSLDEADIELADEDEGLSIEALLALEDEGRLPEGAAQAIMQALGGGNGSRPREPSAPRTRGVNPEAAGVIRASSPFSTGPTGPQPTEEG